VRLKERSTRIEIALFAPNGELQTADLRTLCVVIPLNEALGVRKLAWVGTRQPRRERAAPALSACTHSQKGLRGGRAGPPRTGSERPSARPTSANQLRRLASVDTPPDHRSRTPAHVSPCRRRLMEWPTPTHPQMLPRAVNGPRGYRLDRGAVSLHRRRRWAVAAVLEHKTAILMPEEAARHSFCVKLASKPLLNRA
jgi:hypothetical protein